MNLEDSGLVRRLISDIETSQNRDRREREIKACEVYSGDLKQHVEDRIKQLYPKTFNSFSISDLNLSRKICDKLSNAYKQSPVRELESDQESELYSDLMREIDSAHAWQTFDLYYNLHRYACMWFNYVEVDGEQKIILRPLAPFQFSRVVDKVGDTQVFIVNFPTNELYYTDDTDGRNALIQDSAQDSDYKRYALWSKDQHVVVRYYQNEDLPEGASRLVYENIEGNEANENKLGVIPAVFAQQGDNYALPITNPITEQVIEFNQQYSSMLTSANVQSFGHLVLSHPEDQQMPDEIYNSLFTYSRLPQVGDGAPETTLDYLNPSPNLDSQLAVLNDYGHQIITEHLGDGAQKLNASSTFASGLDRMIAQADITNKIESNQEIYSKAENDLYLVIRAYYEAMNDFRYRSDELSVKYNKAKPVQSEQEILANIEKKMQLGLIEKYEALIMLNPNMSEAAAKEKIEAVKAEKQDDFNNFMVDNGDQRNEETQD